MLKQEVYQPRQVYTVMCSIEYHGYFFYGVGTNYTLEGVKDIIR
jgi:hypothetical protein